MECTECKFKKQLAIKRTKHFELGAEKKRRKIKLSIIKQIQQQTQFIILPSVFIFVFFLFVDINKKKKNFFTYGSNEM